MSDTDNPFKNDGLDVFLGIDADGKPCIKLAERVPIEPGEAVTLDSIVSHSRTRCDDDKLGLVAEEVRVDEEPGANAFVIPENCEKPRGYVPFRYRHPKGPKRGL